MILSATKTFLFYYCMKVLLTLTRKNKEDDDDDDKNKKIKKHGVDLSSLMYVTLSLVIIDAFFVKLIGWYRFSWTTFLIKLFLLLFFLHRLNLYPPNERSLKLTLLTILFYCIHLIFS